MAVEMGRAEFEDLVAHALDEIPPQLAAQLDNVVVLVEDEPPAQEPHLLGLYEGVALTERGEAYGLELPDRIFVYRRPLLEACDDEQQLADEVRTTVVHEIAHHFGIDDERLHALGWG